MPSLPAYPEFKRDVLVGLYGEENALVLSVALPSYVQLLASSPFDPDKPGKVVRRFCRSLAERLRETIAHYSSLADRMLESISMSSEDTKTGVFLPEMQKTPVFREYLLFFETGDPLVLKYLLSFLWFLKKLDLDFRNLESVAFRDWLSIEEEMRRLTIPDSSCVILKMTIGALLDMDHFDDTLLLPKHGSGQVSEKVDHLGEKFDHLVFSDKQRHCFRELRFGFPHAQRTLFVKQGKPRSARLMFVPKSYKTYRSVCMEPAASMYLQQEVMRWLVECIHSSECGRFVDLRDQKRNQEYALHGSAHMGIDTIDLSAASDRVHTDLVRRVFPAKVLYYLLGSRTDSALLPNGERVNLVKFAPMGSAVCFPVQCVLFTAIALIGYVMQHQPCTFEELVSSPDRYLERLRLLLRDMSSNSEDIGRRLISPRVYGDDIACDVHVTDNITYLLGHFGLTVNHGKTFRGGQSVRESCGIYAYNGYDVTPFLLRLKSGSRGPKNPNFFASLVACINRSGDFGYRRLQSFLIHWTTETYRPLYPNSSLPFTEDRNVFGIWTRKKRLPLMTRENRHWQIEEERVIQIRMGGRTQHLLEDAYLYDQWMRSKIHGGSNEFLSSSSRILPRQMRLVQGWTPVRI